MFLPLALLSLTLITTSGLHGPFRSDPPDYDQLSQNEKYLICCFDNFKITNHATKCRPCEQDDLVVLPATLQPNHKRKPCIPVKMHETLMPWIQDRNDKPLNTCNPIKPFKACILSKTPPQCELFTSFESCDQLNRCEPCSPYIQDETHFHCQPFAPHKPCEQPGRFKPCQPCDQINPFPPCKPTNFHGTSKHCPPAQTTPHCLPCIKPKPCEQLKPCGPTKHCTQNSPPLQCQPCVPVKPCEQPNPYGPSKLCVVAQTSPNCQPCVPLKSCDYPNQRGPAKLCVMAQTYQHCQPCVPLELYDKHNRFGLCEADVSAKPSPTHLMYVQDEPCENSNPSETCEPCVPFRKPTTCLIPAEICEVPKPCKSESYEPHKVCLVFKKVDKCTQPEPNIPCKTNQESGQQCLAYCNFK